MESSRYLFNLIKSLNKQEKRYFKLYVAGGAKQKKNNNLILFNIIDKQLRHNEEEIKKKNCI